VLYTRYSDRMGRHCLVMTLSLPHLQT